MFCLVASSSFKPLNMWMNRQRGLTTPFERNVVSHFYLKRKILYRWDQNHLWFLPIRFKESFLLLMKYIVRVHLSSIEKTMACWPFLMVCLNCIPLKDLARDFFSRFVELTFELSFFLPSSNAQELIYFGMWIVLQEPIIAEDQVWSLAKCCQ